MSVVVMDLILDVSYRSHHLTVDRKAAPKTSNTKQEINSVFAELIRRDSLTFISH